MQFRLLGDRAFGDNVPVELDRFVYHAGQVTDNKIQIGDSLRVCFFCVFQSDL